MLVGRSFHVAVGSVLGEWLMYEECNLAKLETILTSCERRFLLMTDLIARAIQHLTNNELDEMRIRFSESSGCLLTWLPTDEYASKIRPQQCMQPVSFSIPRE
jgi:hypothetical protein